MVLLAQAITAPPEFCTLMLFTELSAEPTLKVPGLVTVKAPLEEVQLSALEPFNINISAVTVPPLTEETVILPLAVKSLVAAITGTTNNKANTVVTKNFFIEI